MSRLWLDRIEKLLLIVLGGFVFWPNAVLSVSLILLVIIGAARRGWKIKDPMLMILLLSPALVITFSWALFGFADDGMREIQLWPIWIAALFYARSSPFLRSFLSSYIVFSFGQALIVLAFLTFGEPFSLDALSQLIRDHIEARFHVHPTYLSAAWYWAAFIFIHDLKRPKVHRWSAAAFLVFMATLMSGKMPLLAFGSVLAVYGWLQLNHLKARSLFIIGLVLFLLGNLWFNPTLHQRFDELRQLDMDFHQGQLLTSSELRLGIWKCTAQTIGDQWLAGVGTGNVRITLEDCYRTYDQIEFFEHEYNTHNQILHFWLSAGIIGFIALVGYMTWLLIMGWKQKEKLLFYFSLFFFLICLTENYFNRQLGMTFWSMFAAIYLFRANDSSELRHS